MYRNQPARFSNISRRAPPLKSSRLVGRDRGAPMSCRTTYLGTHMKTYLVGKVPMPRSCISTRTELLMGLHLQIFCYTNLCGLSIISCTVLLKDWKCSCCTKAACIFSSCSVPYRLGFSALFRPGCGNGVVPQLKKRSYSVLHLNLCFHKPLPVRAQRLLKEGCNVE